MSRSLPQLARHAEVWRLHRRRARSLRARVLAWLSTEGTAALWRVLDLTNLGRREW